jgi:exonuclease SbcC
MTVPLNSPVVLIYGANGQGKTSIFSAIELALTGRIASLERFDSDYLKHVPWKNAGQCSVSVATDDGRDSKAVVSNQRVQLTTQLVKNEVRFFRERFCCHSHFSGVCSRNTSCARVAPTRP